MTPNLTDARRRWLSDLYEANSKAVFKLCQRFLNSPDDAADASHEVFLRAAASLTEPPTSPQARAWLMRVARNHCIDVLRRRERFGLALTILGATADADSEAVQAVEDRQVLLAVLEQLSLRDREALWQSAVEGRPLAEIARSFDLSYLAAAQLLSRARRRALVLATRLAVILSLAQLGQAARRSKLARRSQQVAAVVVMPLLIAALVGSSSPHAQGGLRASAKAAGVQSPGASAGHRSPTVSGPLPGTGAATLPAGPGALPVVQPAALPPGPTPAGTTPGPTPVGVSPNPSPASPVDIDVHHGKGRDRDDKIHQHHGHGKARGHGR